MRFPSLMKFIAIIACILFALCAFPSGVSAAKKVPPAPPAPSTEHEAVIEEVNQKQLERILQDKDYVAVYWCKFAVTK